MIDTLPLPGGIYPVEIRVTEGGQVTSTTEEVIYKPAGWGASGKRVKYGGWLGKEQTLLDNGDNGDSEGNGGASAGATLSWLPHPRLTTGVAAQHTDGKLQTGMSADWLAAEKISVSGNAFHSQGYGNGFDGQGSWRYGSGSVMVNHSRSWRDDTTAGVSQGSGLEHNTGITLNHGLGGGDSLTTRLSHRSATGGLGADLSYSTTRNIGDTPVRWRLSGFDRPYGDGESLRNRGVSLDLSLSLGKAGRSYGASLGSRNDNRGQRETYASLTANQEFESGTVRRLSGTLTGDRSGAGLNGSAGFSSPYLSGDGWGQRDAMGGGLSGGLNLENSIALGGGAVAVTHRNAGQRHDTGMIVDVESDDPHAMIRADDVRGGTTTLHAGRNFVPVTAYRSGQVQFDIDGKQAAALRVHPPVADYHLNKGGVGYTKVRVMNTVTVLGRLVDRTGQPLSGAKVVNHAGQSVSEADGFFSLEMHERTPELAVTHRSGTACNIRLPAVQERRDGDTLLAGTLTCG